MKQELQYQLKLHTNYILLEKINTTKFSPVPDLEMLLKVNLNFQVRLTMVLTLFLVLFPQGNGSGGSPLKCYNRQQSYVSNFCSA